MPHADLLALDVGGAAIKAADGAGWAAAEPFPLWREWRRLPEEIGRMLERRPARRVVATMTGEIADCYPSRAAGVRHIVAAIEAAAARGPSDGGIYRVDGSIVPAAEAVARPLEAAASNWHALARLAAHHAASPSAMLIDIGSTTTDLIPIEHGRPAPRAIDDVGRMRSGELVYSGVERTPIAAIVRSLPFRGERRPVATERYADSKDAWVILGGLDEDEHDTDTADGKPSTREGARVRLARMLLVDPDDFTRSDAAVAADWCATAQARQIARGWRRAARERRPFSSVVLSGHGDALARGVLAAVGWTGEIVSLRDALSPAVSRAAPAHALAVIASGDIA